MIEALLAGLFGLLIGSFLNVCIYRMPRDLSVVKPRSHCPVCETTIAWYDNVPVLSWVLLGGKCRHCGAPISWRYPAVELLTGILFFVIVLFLGFGIEALKYCVFVSIMLVLVFTDLDERVLPEQLTIGGALAGVGFAAVVFLPAQLAGFFLPEGTSSRMISLMESITGAAVPAVALLSIGLLWGKLRKREVLGLGDVNMMACIGAFLGIEGALLTLLAGSLLGLAAGMLYMWLAGKDWQTYYLPFGTFLGVAAIGVALRVGLLPGSPGPY